MPTPQEAAAILKAAMDTGFDPVKLATLRSARQRELQTQLVNDDAAAQNPSDHYVQGEPGRKASNDGMLHSNVVRDRGLLDQVTNDITDDPYAGQDERDRLGRIQKSIDTANTTMRPDVRQAADVTAKQNAFAEFMKSQSQAKGQALGKAQGEWSDEAQKAADAQNRRDIQRAEAAKGATFGDLGHGTPNAPDHPLNAADSKSVLSYHDQASLANDVLPLVRKLAGASDEFDKGSWMGRLPGLAQSTWQNTLYKHGISDADVSAALQRIGLAQAKGVASFAGRPTSQWIDLLSQHMAKPGLPWREEERRLAAMVENVDGMPAILPEMEQNLYNVRKGARLTTQPSPSQPRIADPNWGR